jgi:uncharacterized protein (DUF433 family)
MAGSSGSVYFLCSYVEHSFLLLDTTAAGRDAGYDENRRSIMAILDWSQCQAVESVPGRLSGAWVFRDTRMPVSAVFENLEAGATIDEIVEWFDIERERIVAVLEFAARSLDPPHLPNLPARESHAATTPG